MQRVKRQSWAWFLMKGVLACALAGAVSCPTASALTRTWGGSTAGDWSTPGNWANGLPAAGDSVEISSGSVILSASTPQLNGFVITNAALVFTNWNSALTATNVAVLGGASLALPGPFSDVDQTNNIYVVCSNLYVAAGGSIDAEECGFAGVGPYANGYGPGAGEGSVYGAGAGYGGFAWNGRTGSRGGMTYGSAAAPIHPGSSGGGGNTAFPSGISSGSGGGAVRIEAAGTVTVNGSIVADGGDGQMAGGGGGGGSGGSVFIECRVFAGTNGLISASGGNGWWENAISASGGGGGRIALHYDTDAQAAMPVPSTAFRARYGYADNPPPGTVYRERAAEIGTVYLPDATLLTTVLRHTGELQIPGFTSWSPASLSVSNDWVRFPADGFQLNVGGDLIVEGMDGSVGVGGGTLNMLSQPLYSSLHTAPQVSVGGDVILTNGGSLFLYSAISTGTPAYGSRLDVAADVFVGSNSFISLHSHPTNGASPQLELDALVVAAGGSIRADGTGYCGGTNRQDGYGPGASTYSSYPGGAGYGGFGGDSWNTDPVANTYGSASEPTEPGSGGAGNGTGHGCNGGGVVRILAAGDVVVDGTISADARNLYTGRILGGGGSGGAVYLQCRTLDGAGVISAAGGGAGNIHHYGAGGGGRIAVSYNTSLQAWTPGIRFLATPGNFRYHVNPYYGAPHQGEPGTVYWPDTTFLDEVMAHDAELVIPGFTSWAPSSLTVSNGWLRLSPNNFQLSVAGDFTIMGDFGRLDLGGNTVHETIYSRAFPAWSQSVAVDTLRRSSHDSTPGLTVGGNMTLTNHARLCVYSGTTNLASPSHGALVDVNGDTVIATNAVFNPYSHPTNGGSVKLTMANLTLLPGGRIDAMGKGFSGGTPDTAYDAYGPGGAISATSHSGGGGGYGGQGGRAYYANAANAAGAAYGDETAPTGPGSGGAGGSRGGDGGGAVWIEVDGTVAVCGAINADGITCGSGGGGAGGGIYIFCRTFVGSSEGILSAAGARPGGNWSGGGAGGRIAVRWRSESGLDLVSTNVAGGLFISGEGRTEEYSGATGTIFFAKLPPMGTLFMCR